jgi:sn-glycerol 3-phosphate transport system ATP-binding protein
MMAELTLHRVSKRFPGHVALGDVSLSVEEGEFLAVVGPSGCGKSTALRIIAGLEKPSSGEVRIGGVVMNDRSPAERDIAMVFQNYALYPHMSVYRNLAYGLKQRHTPKAEINRRVRRISAMLDLEPLLNRKPGQLSGGQRQRVAMGRALVREPQVFLLDEPLSNLDAKLRGEVRAELKRLHQQVPITSLYVTHDQVEAMTLGDRIAVMRDGRLQQLGTPHEIYDKPANTFVAGFMGTPSANLLPGTAQHGRLRVGTLDLELCRPATGEVVVGVRPEQLRVAGADEAAFDFRVDVVEPLGYEVIVHGTVTVDGPEPGQRAPVAARFRPHDRPTPGSTLPLTVDPKAVHVFDRATGTAIRAV